MELYFSLTGLINAVTSITLGALVFLKNKRAKVNQTFALFCLSVFIWGLFYIFWPLAETREATLFWFRMLHVGSIFISITYFHFIIHWLGLYQKKKGILFLGYLLAFFFLSFVFSPLFIKDMVPKFSMRYWAEPGILYHFYLMMFFGFALYSFYLLFRHYLKSRGIKREQIKYVLLGIVIAYVGGSTNYFLWYDINFPPYGNVLGMAFVVSSAYAIAKYRLLNIRIILGKGAVYLLSFGITIFISLGLMFLNNELPTPLPTNIILPSSLIIGILLFQPIFRFFEKIASKYFYYTFYSYQKVITELGKSLTRVLELDRLASLIADTLINTMRLDRAGVLLRDPESKKYQIQKVIGFKEENGISLVRDNFLTQYLARTKKPLVHEEIEMTIRDSENEVEKESLERLRDNMAKIEASLCLPLFREDKIIGIIVLGRKISGDPYSEQDIELLENLSNQAAIALENARLYDQVQDLSKNLQKKVDEQTKELKKAYEVEKKARQELQGLSEAKNQFIMATQHHLRTPLTSMTGYIDLILSGTYGKVSPKMKEPMVKLQTSTKRLIRIVNEILDISQFQLGKQVVDLKIGVDMEAIVDEMVEELSFEAKSKDIYLKLKKPQKKIPKVKADEEKIKVALFNLVDNAIKYTTEGGVVIKLETKEDKLRISIKDTGIGIPEEDLPNLFGRLFERGKKAKKVFATGKGIGLFISSRIVKAHQGKIWAESEGKGKGSTFFVDLPIK